MALYVASCIVYEGCPSPPEFPHPSINWPKACRVTLPHVLVGEQGYNYTVRCNASCNRYWFLS